MTRLFRPSAEHTRPSLSLHVIRVPAPGDQFPEYPRRMHSSHWRSGSTSQQLGETQRSASAWGILTLFSHACPCTPLHSHAGLHSCRGARRPCHTAQARAAGAVCGAGLGESTVRVDARGRNRVNRSRGASTHGTIMLLRPDERFKVLETDACGCAARRSPCIHILDLGCVVHIHRGQYFFHR